MDGKGNLTSCTCPATYTGERCESLYCPSDYCCNGGTCSVVSATNPPYLKCTCSPGFKGQYCEIDIDFCTTVESSCSGLECIEGIGTKIHCLCPAECCTNCTSPCLSGPCITNGTCEIPADKGCTCLGCHTTQSSCVLYASSMSSSAEATYGCAASSTIISTSLSLFSSVLSHSHSLPLKIQPSSVESLLSPFESTSVVTNTTSMPPLVAIVVSVAAVILIVSITVDVLMVYFCHRKNKRRTSRKTQTNNQDTS